MKPHPAAETDHHRQGEGVGGHGEAEVDRRVGEGAGESAEGGERHGPVLGAPGAPEAPQELPERRGERHGDEREAKKPRRHQHFQDVAVGVDPGPAELRRLHPREGLAKGPEPGAEDGGVVEELQGVAVNLEAYVPGDLVGRGLHPAAEPLLVAEVVDPSQADGQGAEAGESGPPPAIVEEQHQGLDEERQDRGHEAAARAGEGEGHERHQEEKPRYGEQQQAPFGEVAPALGTA